ncbi:MAG: TetR family transcriptional regulator C-terminal domain-containing protein [Acidobacteriota bacterium]|nr:TetR family transcriptional regulator C-terminal domain-containing protein [Acidobacteriota bacterium]
MSRDTKKRLLEKGLEILMHKGYNHTGIQEVLAAVGVPKGSFYHYFRSKHDFGMQILEYYTRESQVAMQEIFDDPKATPLQRIKNFFAFGREKMAANNFSGGCFIGNMSQEMGDLCPEFQEVLESKWAVMRDNFVKCIREARESGELQTGLAAEDLADFLINSWQGALMRMKVAKSSRPLDVFTSAVFERLVTSDAVPAA